MADIIKAEEAKTGATLLRYLVLVNPFSGKRRALNVFEDDVAPKLAEKKIDYVLVVTDHPNHAWEIVQEIKPSEFDAIVIVSGDGLIFEVINGLMCRSDWKAAIRLPLGIVPGGSGNALAASIAYLADPAVRMRDPDRLLLDCSELLTSQHTTSLPLDLVYIETPLHKYYSSLAVCIGLASDIDIESERYRFLGPLRFTFGSIVRLLHLRTYDVRLSFLPTGEYTPPKLTPTQKVTSRQHIRRAQTVPADLSSVLEHLNVDDDEDDANNLSDYHALNNNGELNTDFPEDSGLGGSFASLAEEASAATVVKGLKNVEPKGPKNTMPQPWPTRYLTPLDQDVPPDWVQLHERFIAITAIYQSHLGAEYMMVPEAKLDDGIIYLSIMRAGISKKRLVDLLSAMGKGETPPKESLLPYAETIPCRAFRIEPQNKGSGIMTLDGEVIEFGPLQGEICPNVARYLSVPTKF